MHTYMHAYILCDSINVYTTRVKCVQFIHSLLRCQQLFTTNS